jgi:hypothetical protein
MWGKYIIFYIIRVLYLYILNKTGLRATTNIRPNVLHYEPKENKIEDYVPVCNDIKNSGAISLGAVLTSYFLISIEILLFNL